MTEQQDETEIEQVRQLPLSAFKRMPDGTVVVELPEDCTGIILDGNG